MMIKVNVLLLNYVQISLLTDIDEIFLTFAFILSDIAWFVISSKTGSSQSVFT